MNLAEAMLAADAGKVTAKATKAFEVKRLSELFGTPFILNLQQISTRRFKELQESNVSVDNKGKANVDTYNLQLMLVVEGVTNKDFNDKAVLKHFGAATKKDLFEILLNAGEIADISQAVSALCGFGDTSKNVEEIKN